MGERQTLLRCTLTIVLLLFAAIGWAADPPDSQTPVRLAKLQKARNLHKQGQALYEAGQFPDATKVFADGPGQMQNFNWFLAFAGDSVTAVGTETTTRLS